MIREIHNKLDQKFDALDTSKKSSLAKAFAIGFAEGAIDGLAIVGAATLVVLPVMTAITLSRLK